MSSYFATLPSTGLESGPKYCQIIDLILKDIDQNIFRPGDRIPSIKEASEEHLLSRDTVEKAYRELSQRGILISVPGKGYYVKGKTARSKLRVLSLFSHMGPEEQGAYNALLQGLGKNAISHLHCYGQNEEQFVDILSEHLGDFDYYVVWPRFAESSEKAWKLLKKIPQNKLILLGKKVPKSGHSPELTKALNKALQGIKSASSSYSKWTFLCPTQEECASTEWLHAFTQSAHGHKKSNLVSFMDADFVPTRGSLYFIWSNRDLEAFIRHANTQGLSIGQDLGVISFHEHPLKAVLAGGITTIDLHTEKMGKEAAEMILHNNRDNIQPSVIIHQRASV